MGQKPKVLKTINHLHRIQDELSRYSMIDYGGSNPYSYCSYCEASIVEINGSKGHRKNCKVAHYEKLEKKVSKKLEYHKSRFLKHQDFNKKSFINYVQLKKDQSINGLTDLLNDIDKYLENNLSVDGSMYKFYNLNKPVKRWW